MSKLLWISVPGSEYQAMIRTLTINLKALPDGRYLLVDSRARPVLPTRAFDHRGSSGERHGAGGKPLPRLRA